MAGIAFCSLVMLVIWNGLDPSPPAWDEAQHLLMAQTFGEHLRHFDGDPQWWGTFWHLSQRYPPLTYGLGLFLSPWRIFGRSEGQLINLLLLGILTGATYRIGALGWDKWVGGLGAGLIWLYPSITGLAHVYMTDLPLVVTVALGGWAALRYGLKPSWIGATGLGIAIGLVMLTKWNGLLFLVWPLALIGGRIVILRRWHQILHLLLALGITIGICWGWYGANWVFVITNGLNYSATTHYYVECPAGSLCWWTIYLRLLPDQMSPVLCGLPLLILIPGIEDKAEVETHLGILSKIRSIVNTIINTIVNKPEFWLISTYLVGYLIYTLIGIKTIRFTMPLLPLLAVISAVGIARLSQRWVDHSRGLSWGMALVGSCALFWSGQPLAPGVTGLAQSIFPADSNDAPQTQLIRWLETQAEPNDPQRTLVGVLPNTELISSETLSYLAKLTKLPLDFVPLGQSEWPELEIPLVDRYLNRDGDWGVIGPYGPAKETILEILQTDPNWRAHPPLQVGSIDTLQTFDPDRPPIQIQATSSDSSEEIQVIEARSLRSCEIQSQPCSNTDPQIAAWEITWTGAVADLARTAVWIDLIQADQVIATGEFSVGDRRLRRDLQAPVRVKHRFSLPSDPPISPGSYQLSIHWQPDPHSSDLLGANHIQIPVQIDSPQSLTVPEDPLQLTAQAMAIGDLDHLSKYLNVWTTLRYDPTMVDPDLDLQRRLLRGRLQQAQEHHRLEDQRLLRYQLGLIEVVQLRAKQAQDQFEILTQLDPDNDWNRAYVAFLRIFFTHDLTSLEQEIRAILYVLYTDQALCRPAEDESQTDICRFLEDWELLPKSNPDQLP